MSASAITGNSAVQPYTAQPSAPEMLGFRQILVCTDFSASSEAAVQAAMSIWRRTGAHITLLHVVEFGPMPATTDDGIDYIQGLYPQRRKSLDMVAAKLRKMGAEVDAVMLDGNAPAIILEQIDWVHADLAVMGTRGTRGFERLVFGSTAEAVFRQSPCPVLTVNAAWSASQAEALERNPVMFATDFNDSELMCSKLAIAMANSFGVTLHCVHVLPSGAEEDEASAEVVVLQALRCLTENGAISVPTHKILHGTDVSRCILITRKKIRCRLSYSAFAPNRGWRRTCRPSERTASSLTQCVP